MVRSFRPGLFALVGCSLLVVGCPEPAPVPDAGPVEEPDAGGEVDAGEVDAGQVDGGFRCRLDDDCLALGAANPEWRGLRCDNDTLVNGTLSDGGEPSYTCVAGTPCNGIGECQSFDSNDYCLVSIANSKGCRCDTTQALPDAGGVCMRRKPPCSACTTGPECGDDSAYFDPPGDCRALQGDSSGKKYCFQAATGICPAGTVNQNGYCVPQSNSCENVGCLQDSDCPGGSLCNPENRLCELRCRWNFDRKQTIPDCAPGKSCWVDEPNLDPTSSFFGAGRCKPTCLSNAECSYGGTFADGGQKLACRGEATGGSGDGGATSPARCRPNGQCMDDLECPDPGSSVPSKGYCDRASYQCKQDCRIGTDPLTGNSYSDCKTGYACRDQGGVNTCVELSCAEFPGVAIACPAGNLCDGEDRNGDGVPERAPTGAVKDSKGCYLAPKPPWCQLCSPDGGPGDETSCVGLNNQSAMPNECLYGGNKGMAPGIFYCALGAANDFTRDDAGVSRANRFCPAGWSPAPQIVDVIGDGQNFCNTDADCRKGNSSSLCSPYGGITFQDGGHPKACMCNNPGTTDCPIQADAGVYSFCQQGLFPSVCITSVVCTPGFLLYTPTAQNGCGL